MRLFSSVACGALALAFACFQASAQFTTSRITFRNPGPYNTAELEQTAGLHGAEKTSRAGIQAAAQRLMDTGFFDNVQVDSKGTPGALEVIFLLTPASALKDTPVGFENFVWLTPEEFKAALGKGAPLFHGSLPEAGNQMDAVTAALTAALAAKGLTSPQVTHELLLPTTAQPVSAYEFRVEAPTVRVHSIALSGGLPALAAQEAALQAKLRGTPYAAGFARDATTGFLLQPYRNAGYLDARLDDLRTGIVSSPAEGVAADGVAVDVTATLVPGEPYRVGALQFAGTPLVSSAQFESAAKLHPGDVASRALLLQTLATVDTPYRRQGYMDEYADAGAVLDAAAHTVSYTVTVVPGDQYRVGTVTPLNLSPEARAQFDLAWTMKPGELYNPDYVGGFLGNHRDLRSLAGYTASFHGAGDPQTHLVDLTITFIPTKR